MQMILICLVGKKERQKAITSNCFVNGFIVYLPPMHLVYSLLFQKLCSFIKLRIQSKKGTKNYYKGD